MAHLSVFVVESKSTNPESTFLFRVEFGGLWPIRYDEVACSSDHNSEETFQNEDPSPSVVASNTFHMSDGIRKKTRESSGNDTGAEEKVDPPLKFVPFVEHGDQVDAAREEASLKCPEDDSTHDKTSE